MSKKIMKRSLALGALMAFVITGSAMAAETNSETYKLNSITATTFKDFSNESGLIYLQDSGYCNFFPAYESEASNEVVTTGDIEYKSNESYGGHLGLIAGMSIVDSKGRIDENQKFANPNKNTLRIKHNVKADNGCVYLFGSCIGNGADSKYDNTAKNNSVYVGEENKQITIGAGNHIFIGGALSNEAGTVYDVQNNQAIVNNVVFELPDDKYVCIYGAEARSGSAQNNTAEIKDTSINNANIFGGFVWNKGGDATSNTVTFNNVTLGNNSESAGGYVYSTNGNANENTVNIEGNSQIAGVVYGGYSTNGSASKNTINIKDFADVSQAKLYGDNDSSDGTDNTLNVESGWVGSIDTVGNFDTININNAAVVTLNTVENCDTANLDGSILELTKATKFNTVNAKNDGKIAFGENGHLDVNTISGTLNITEAGKTADDVNTTAQLSAVAAKLGVKDTQNAKAKVVMAEGVVVGEVIADVTYDTVVTDGYYHGKVEKANLRESVNTTNAGIAEMQSILLMAWRAENNDMHKRLGELRDANGEHGAWARMTRGESEYKSVKNQYNAYQLGYDQKAGDWTVGAAVTYTEGETSFAKGTGENDHTGLAVYGSKLNKDGSYIDLVAKYANLDHEYTARGGIGSGEYDTDGFALSAEYGKRFEQGNGLWIEPQVELTYGLVDSVDFEAANGRVSLDNMNSLVGRVGFRAGKDIKDGNVYVRASYLYDFEGETDISFTDGVHTRNFEQDLGGGWWELGIGTNINLSKATYIYADVEHACGGEVDTDWKWNLGVRYSF